MFHVNITSKGHLKKFVRVVRARERCYSRSRQPIQSLKADPRDCENTEAPRESKRTHDGDQRTEVSGSLKSRGGRD